MIRTVYAALVLGLLLARPLRPGQQPNAQPPNQEQKQEPGESSSRANPDHPQPAEASTESSKDTSAADAPSAAAAHDMEVAEYYLRKGDVDAAIGRLQDAIQLQPKLPRPYLLLGRACERKRDKAAAAKYYREYLRLSPNAPDAQKIEKKIEKLTAR